LKPLESLRYDVTPVGLHYLLIHYDIPEIDPNGWRLRIEGPWQSVDPPATSGATRKLKGRRPIYSEEQGDVVEADVIDRYALGPGDVVHGPAVRRRVMIRTCGWPSAG